MKKEIYLGGLSLLLTACGGINYVGIETCNPGEVTFPQDVRKVLMVNNAIAQPEKSGYTYSLLGVVQDTARAKADSALFDLCASCGTAILDASYFEDVLLFHDPLRDAGSSLVDQKLTRRQVDALCRSNDADAVISLDKMLFAMERKDVNIGAGYLTGTITVKMQGVMRAYLPDRDNSLATILIEDSVEFQQAAEDLRMLNYYLPTADEALRMAASALGSKVSGYFVPHWTEETRWYYSNADSRWKEASAFASSSKWDTAKAIWLREFESTSSKHQQAKLASNIALSYEMQSQLDKAYEWAKKSYDLFMESYGEKSRNTELLKAYSEVLKARILADKKLNTQIGSR